MYLADSGNRISTLGSWLERSVVPDTLRSGAAPCGSKNGTRARHRSCFLMGNLSERFAQSSAAAKGQKTGRREAAGARNKKEDGNRPGQSPPRLLDLAYLHVLVDGENGITDGRVGGSRRMAGQDRKLVAVAAFHLVRVAIASGAAEIHGARRAEVIE